LRPPEVANAVGDPLDGAGDPLDDRERIVEAAWARASGSRRIRTS
jgi:hypothetical protein